MRRETTESLGHGDMRLEEKDSKPVHCAMLRRDIGAIGAIGARAWGFWQLFQRCFQSVCALVPMQASGISCWHKK
jgi:hypothetical protein